MELQRRTELFRKIVRFIDNNVEETVEQELLGLFEAIVSTNQQQQQQEQSDNKTPPPHVSTISLQFLETNLWLKPSLVHWAIDQLLCIWSSSFTQTDSSLQDIYHNFVKDVLKEASIYSVSEAQRSSHVVKNTNFVNEQHLGLLLCILSKFNLTEEKENELNQWFYPILLKSCTFEDVELSFYCRKDSKFYRMWHKFLDDIFARRRIPETLEYSLKITYAIFDSEQGILRPSANETFTRTIRSKRHWLTDILNISYILTINNRLDLVSRILESRLFPHFWLLILFKILADCPEIGAQKLKLLLTNCQLQSLGSEIFDRLEVILSHQFDVIEWISINAHSPSKIPLKHILNNLQSSSTLSVLKSYVNLHEFNYDIVNLLKDCEESKTIFRAYAVMLNALRGIMLCDNYNNEFEKVSECFSQMEKYLNTLNPLTIRLETIENIFSMLFMRHDDFLEQDSPSDCGAEDGDEEQKSRKDNNKQKNLRKEISKQHQAAGFVCNKYAIRESVHYLSRCLFVATNDSLRKKKEFGDCQIVEEIQQRISSMKKYLSEAVWRLELLTSSEFVKKQGLPDSDVQIGSTTMTNTLINQSVCRENFYQANESSSDETETRSDVDLSSESGSMANNSCSRSRSRRKLRSICSNAAPAADGAAAKKESTLNYMLATGETLVLRCLWKNHYAEAQRVIETLGMESSHLAGEILFSRAINNFREEVTKQKATESDVDSPSRSKHSTIEMIRKAVKDGLQASRTTSQLETFLASQEHNNLLHSDKSLMSLTALDLTLTSSHDYTTSENLTEVTKKHFEFTEKLTNTPYFDLFQTIYQLLHEHKPATSVMRIISDARSPLSLREYKKRSKYWAELEDNLKPFEAKTKLVDRIQSEEKQEEEEEEESQLKDQFRHLLTICNDGDPYLHNVDAHLNILMTICPPSTEESLLRNSLDFYIGYQIFDLHVDIQLLEKVANNLQINLVYSILINCSPKLLYYDSNEPKVLSDRWGVVILNKYREQFPEFHCDTSSDPNQCVIRILSELLQLITQLNPDPTSVLGQSELKVLSNNEEIEKVLRKTKCLSTVDLSHLSFGNHTLSFFLNLWNLLFLHALIKIWSYEPPVNDLRHAVSLRTIAYDVGDLGLITIFTLRSKLVGYLSSDYGACFDSHLEELNEPAWQDLDLQQDPRTIFGMINEYEGSPIFQIYHPDTLNDNLNAAMKHYLDFYKTPVGEKFILPDIFERVQEDNLLQLEDSIELSSLKYAYNLQLNYAKIPERKNKKLERLVSKTKGAWRTREICPDLLQYLENHCWLLCYLIQRIHEDKWPMESLNFDNRRTAVLENLLNSQPAQSLRLLFEGNRVLAGLQNHLAVCYLWDSLEDLLVAKQLKKALDLLNNLADTVILRNLEIQRLKDKILSDVINDLESNAPEILQHLYVIRDVQTLTQVVLSKVKVWPVRICEEALRYVLNHSHKNYIPGHCRSELNEILCRVMVFDKMLPYFKHQVEKSEFNWYHVVYRTEKTDPIKIVKSLIDAKQYELCLEWLEYQTAASSDIHCLVSQNLFIGLLNNNNDDFKQARKLLSALPFGQSEKLCKGVIEKLQSIEALKFVITYLLENSTDKDKYKRGSLGVDLLSKLEIKDRPNYIHLITEPLLLLEQLLMNCKFENLQRILKSSMDKLMALGFTGEKFDEIVRFYAKKSLDLRVAIQRDNQLTDSSRVRESPIQAPEFIMPLNVPTREEWVPNDKARECSCCRNVIFSMFNRRHHCRRCGRVVCAACSSQRMRVAGYANSVLVRVCNDCKKQTAQLQLLPSTTSSESFDCWKLTSDENHNKTLREEFCFEYAPNISLCLAILNLHSDHEAYANFLQDRCDEMKMLLYPDNKGQINREIDHALIIKMIRSLLIAAKVKCAKLGLNTGLTHCDRFLSQVDLLDTLVMSDCLSLLPRDNLNEHTFRRLRDLLTEKEQWTLALDVSTKSGLDTQGVWAAWGKACLKVGYYERAREKFLHCLDKVNQEDFDDWVLLPYPSPKTNRKEIKSTKNRPAKDPPLVVEILQILEASNSTEQYSKSQLSHTKNNTAQEIMNTLANLKAISHGQYTIPKLTPNSKNIRYQESLYYLLMYGSFNSILEFFIRHDELDKCLSYALENDIDQEIFFNVAIIGCLKSGKFMKLCETMRQKDTSLIMWRKYLIATCLYLERKQLMNTLYNLQLFMKDYVRAAMTCIKFYVTDATTYIDLCTRTHFLLEAQKHLESELQVESFGKKRRKSVSSNLSGHSGSLTMEMEPSEIDKHVSTICRQMEIAKFLANCEKEGRNVADYLSKLSYMESEGLQPRSVPTLFGNQKERTHLAVLAILCGRDVEEGFGFAFRIMQDYYLSPQKVYSLVGHVLALDKRVGSIEQLIKCCRSSGAPNSQAISDRVLAHCVKLLLDRSKAESSPSPKDQIDSLIRIINDVELKIDSYIESKQLKAAYLLAVKHSRAQDIRKILREADRLGQGAIKSICTKWLQQANKK